MNLGIVAQRGNDRAVSLATELTDALEGVSVTLDEATASAVDATGVPVGEMVGYPLVVSIGGDGTFLYVARHVGSTPILGVNLGEVGFLNAVTPDEAVERVREEVERVRETGAVRFREAHRVVAEGDGWSVGPGLNEVVVQGPLRGRGQGVEVEVRLDGSTYAGGHADGVLVATPTGSTAYNLSEGGPLVHPLVDGLVVTRMCPVEAMPPIVVGPDREVTVRVSGVDEVVVVADGSERRWIDAPATVAIHPAADPARIAGPRSDFPTALDKIDRADGR